MLHRSYLPILAAIELGACFAPLTARADIDLPYTTRTHQYSAWGTTVQGDIETVGMAGAMVGLASSRLGSVDNPAGLPLTLDSTGIQITGNSVQDGYLQSYASPITSSTTVITFCPYPWGASFATFSPQQEGDVYQVGGTGEALEVKTREYHLSFANLFFGDHLSLGLSFIVGENDQTFTMSDGGSITRTAWGYGANIGALYTLPDRFFLGMSFTPPIHYAMDSEGDINPAIAGFFQDASSPYRLGLGVGWMPNRLFSASADLYIFGPTPNTALLSDDSTLVGVNTTLQPRLGFSYRMMEYKNLTVNLEAGSYLEVMRTEDDATRLHGTIGIEIKPWIFNLGWGLDEARYYQNFIYSAGVDVGRLLKKLDMIPKDPPYPKGGTLPDPSRLSEEGLPHALNSQWKQRDDGAISVGLKMPGKIRDRITNPTDTVRLLGNDLLDSIETIPEQGIELWRKTMGVEPRDGDPRP